MARKLMDELKQLTKPNKIVLMTQTAEVDPVFEDLHKREQKRLEEWSLDKNPKKPNFKPYFIHVNISNDPFLFSLTPEHLKESLVIIDDYENTPKAIQTFFLRFITDLLERSRKMKTNIIIINHQSMNYNKTRPIIFECDNYVVFPFTNKNSTKNFLTSYADLDKSEIDNMIEDSSDSFNFLLFRKSYPMYC